MAVPNEYLISQFNDVLIYKEESLFLTVKRSDWWKMKSKFYFNDKLIFQTSTLDLGFHKNINIKFQSLPNHVDILKEGGKFFLQANGNEYYVDLKIKNFFRKPKYDCFLNGVLVGFIEARYFAQLGGQDYIMRIQMQDEWHHIYFQLLYVSQLIDLG